MPSPVVPSAKYALKTNYTDKSSGLGLTVGTNSVTITGLVVGRPLTLTTYLNASGIQNYTVTGSTTIVQGLQSNGSDYPIFSYIGNVKASSVSVTFSVNIGSAKYLFLAYQV